MTARTHLEGLRAYLAAYRDDLRWAWPYNVERARFTPLLPLWLVFCGVVLAVAWTAHFIRKARSHG